MNSPKCFKCKTADAAFFPAFQTFTAYKPHLPVARHTMDVAFCGPCSQELTVSKLLIDSIWNEIVRKTHQDLNGKRDSTGQPMPAPKLDRGRTTLSWAPFMRIAGPKIIRPGPRPIA